MRAAWQWPSSSSSNSDDFISPAIRPERTPSREPVRPGGDGSARRQRNARAHRRSPAGTPADADLSTQQAGALAHGEQADRARSVLPRFADAGAIVRDVDEDAASFLTQ